MDVPTEIIGVRFKTVGKVYHFDSDNLDIKKGDCVIVETVRGLEFGRVEFVGKQLTQAEIVAPIKKVVRIATPEDIEKEKANKIKEKNAFEICQTKIKEHNLDMKLIDAEFTFDVSKVLFYFTSEGRIDFRDLVKDLASIFRTRIELRQIGVRDEAKTLNGIGICGRTLCCATFLDEFQPVSIKMAKDQNLSLNPTKISGICGRLMCCLKYEEETYEELNKNLPKVGDIVETADGKGEVASVNVIRQLVKVIIKKEGNETLFNTYNVEEITFNKKPGKSEYKKDNKDNK